MDYQQTASQILDKVGGAGNIAAMEHCSTRLRLTIADNSRVDVAALKAIPGVLGVVQTGQTQIIIGNEVVEVFAALQKEVAASGVAPGSPSGAAPKRSWGAVFLDFLVGVFQPLVPAIAGAGVLKSILILLAAIGWLSTKDQTYIALAAISDATFYFLPLMVAVTTATKLNANRLVALAAVGVLLLPALTTQIAAEGGFRLFGIPVQNVPYSGQVFPAILSVLLLAAVERLATKYSPKPVRIFLVPMIALLITVPATLLLLGPLGFFAGQAFTGAIVAVYSQVGWVATALLAAVLPLVVSVGMHKALLPYALSQFAATGREAFYLPASLAHNIAEGGAMFGVALRTRNQTTRATAISAGISALCGITEPALYGITIQHKRALYSVMAGAAAGGAYIGIMLVQAFVVVGPGLPSLSMFVDAANPANLLHAVIAAAISFGVAGLMVFLLWKDSEELVTSTYPDDKAVASSPESEVPALDNVDLVAPMTGKVISLDEVPDAVFSGGALGKGVAIVPTDGLVTSPAEGTIANVFKTGHAVALKTDSGAEVLIHVGLDTVKLEGAPFEVLVTKGERVSLGQPLLRADLSAIREAGYDTTTPVVVLNAKQFNVESLAEGSTVDHGDPVVAINAKELVK